MKIALCLMGWSKGSDIKKVYSLIKENILDLNDVDIFIHTWNDKENEIEEIKKLYKPKDSVFKEQIMFDDTNPYLHKTKSRWYSHMKALELKKQYEDKHNFKYDFVMVTRFDICFRAPFIFSEYDSDYFYLTDESDSQDPHCSRNQLGWNDAWFFSNSETMDKYSNVYVHIDEYQRQAKLWVMTLCEGAHFGYSTDITDKNFPARGYGPLGKYHKNTIDHHTLAKHHAMCLGLTSKTKFIKGGNCILCRPSGVKKESLTLPKT